MAKTMTRRLPDKARAWINDLEKQIVTYSPRPAPPPTLPHNSFEYRESEYAAYTAAVDKYNNYITEWKAEYTRTEAQLKGFHAKIRASTTPVAEKLEMIYEIIQLDHTTGMLAHFRLCELPLYVSIEQLHDMLTSEMAALARKGMKGDLDAKQLFCDFVAGHPEATYSSISPVY